MIPLNNMLYLPKHDDYFIYGYGSCAKHFHSILTLPQKKNFQGFIHKERTVKMDDYFVYSIDDFFSKNLPQDTLIIVASSYWRDISRILLKNSYHRLFIYPR